MDMTMSCSRWASALVLAWAALMLSGASATASPGVPDETHIIDGVSCPEASFCAAFTIGGTYIATANPLKDDAWSAVNVIEENAGTTGLSCPSATFCAAVDMAGDVITSTDPGDPAPSWKIAHVDGNLDSRGAAGFSNGTRNLSLEGISCPSPTLCLAVDQAGNVLSSTKPDGGAGTWRTTKIDGADQFVAISCAPNSTFCAAVDVTGHLSVSSQASSDAAAWHTVLLDPEMNFQGISCPSTDFCMAIDYNWRVFTSTEPANPYSWAVTGEIPTPSFYAMATTSQTILSASASGATTEVGVAGQNILSCPSRNLCVIPSYHTQEIWTTTNPADNPSAWAGTRPQQLPEGSNDTVTSVGCSGQLCVGGGWFGEGLVSQSPTNGPSAWPTTLAAAVLPPAPSRPYLSGLSLRGRLKRRRGAFHATRGHARLRFTLTSAPTMHPLVGARFMNWTGYRKVRGGGYAPNYNGFTVRGSKRLLAKSIRVTSRGHRLPHFLKKGTQQEVSIYLKKPTRTMTVTLSGPALELTRKVIRAAEHRKQTKVRMYIQGWDEIGGGEAGFHANFMTNIRVVKHAAVRHRTHRHHHHRRRHRLHG